MNGRNFKLLCVGTGHLMVSLTCRILNKRQCFVRSVYPRFENDYPSILKHYSFIFL
jgi:hypothetical protein